MQTCSQLAASRVSRDTFLCKQTTKTKNLSAAAQPKINCYAGTRGPDNGQSEEEDKRRNNETLNFFDLLAYKRINAVRYC